MSISKVNVLVLQLITVLSAFIGCVCLTAELFLEDEGGHHEQLKKPILELNSSRSLNKT